ncbi:SDR family NAD(P)-dependent oxidoreductase [Streptomyces milbemycinicus]|uniref:SDR family NAD(P)-dependent oxidoreductase n=1 Tax=Streptomyces milbemycinicus TaxID=476552 RepID=UPI0033C1080E
MNEPHAQLSDVPAEVLGKIRSAVQALPQVSEAVALDWRVPLPMRGRHLADVLPTVLAREPTDTAEGTGADTTEDATAAPDDEALAEYGTPADCGIPAEEGTPVEGGAREPSILGSGSLGLPVDHPRTLQAALARAAEKAPDRGITFLTRQGTSVHMTYSRLLADAERALTGLRALGLRPGDSVLFQFDANHSFVTAFWACVLGGFLPAPLAVVPDGERDTGKLRNTWSLLGHPLILTDLDAAELADALSGQWGTGVRVAAVADIMADRRDRNWFAARPDSPALNLLTSGSTGLPKCVRHNHHSIVARTWGDAVVNRLTEEDVTLNWIAMDHVMGSVMAHTRDVFLCCAQVNVTPDMFAARPLNWLDWIDRYRVTNISAPNFAFALVNRHADEIAEGRWDLSSLRVVYNGGEPVVSGTAHTFLTLLARHGLRPDAMMVVWGMSETASAVTHAPLSRDDRTLGVVVLDQDSLGGDLRPARPGSPRTVTFTSVGEPVPGALLRIVDARGAVVPRGRVGRLEVSGETMMTGYFGNEEANAEAYTADGWFRTGDLAFVWDGGLVIAGRERDLIIVNGANYFCHEIEDVVTSIPGVAPSSAAACGLFSPDIGTDRLLVFFVPDPEPATTGQPERPEGSDDDGLSRQAGLVRAITTGVAARTGLVPYRVVPLAAEEFPRTVSGKIQRGQLLASYTVGSFDERLRRLEVVEEGPRTVPPWFFAPVWEEAPLRAAAPPAKALNPLVLFADDHEDGLLAGATAVRMPGPVIVVRPADGPYGLREQADGYRLDPEDETGYRALLTAVAREHPQVDGIVHAWSLAGDAPEDVPGGLRRGALSVARLVRALADSPWPTAALLVATRLPVAAEGASPAPTAPGALANGALTGLVRSVATERGEGVTRLIDVADDAGRAALITAIRAELASSGETLTRYAAGRRLAARLQPIAAPTVSRPGGAFRDGALYAITGGSGGIGQEIAHHLAAAYGAKVLLLGRRDAVETPAPSPLPPESRGEIRYERADVTDTHALGDAVARAEQAWRQPLAGVLHLAGRSLRHQWDDITAHVVAREPAEEYERTLAPKTAGTIAAAHLLDDRPDACLLLFSSVNGYFGGTGFGAYAAASSFQDAFAAYWSRSRGRDVRSLAWSQWSGVGMNADGPMTAAAAARGFRPITLAQGLGSLLLVCAGAERHLLIGLDAHNPDISPLLADTATRRAVLLGYTGGARAEDVLTAAAGVTGGGVPVHVASVPALPHTPAGEIDGTALARLAIGGGDPSRTQPPKAGLETDIARVVCDVLGRGFIGREESFFEVGGNSLFAARLQHEVARRLERRLPLRALYRHPTVRALATALREQEG